MGGGVVAGAQPLGEPVARVACQCLQVSLLGEPDALDGERDADGLAQGPAVLLVALRLVSQPIVHVEGGGAGAQADGHVEQAHGVRAARDHHKEVLVLGYQPALGGRVEYRVRHGALPGHRGPA